MTHRNSGNAGNTRVNKHAIQEGKEKIRSGETITKMILVYSRTAVLLATAVAPVVKATIHHAARIRIVVINQPALTTTKKAIVYVSVTFGF